MGMTNDDLYCLGTADDGHPTYHGLRAALEAAARIGATGQDVTVYAPNGGVIAWFQGSDPIVAAELRTKVAAREEAQS